MVSRGVLGVCVCNTLSCCLPIRFNLHTCFYLFSSLFECSNFFHIYLSLGSAHDRARSRDRGRICKLRSFPLTPLSVLCTKQKPLDTKRQSFKDHMRCALKSTLHNSVCGSSYRCYNPWEVEDKERAQCKVVGGES
jgi:hypothetical protein